MLLKLIPNVVNVIFSLLVYTDSLNGSANALLVLYTCYGILFFGLSFYLESMIQILKATELPDLPECPHFKNHLNSIQSFNVRFNLCWLFLSGFCD